MSLVDGALRVCTSSREVFWGATKMRLKPKEYALLQLLMENADQVLTRQWIIERMYDWREPMTEDVEAIVDIFVEHLRKKFEAFTGAPLPISSRDAGYIYGTARLPRTSSPDATRP